MNAKDTQIRTRSTPQCGVCGDNGEAQYQGLSDRLFGVPGEWDMKKCVNPDCGLFWLDPMPIKEDINKAYQTYYTHQDPKVAATTFLRRFYRRIKAGYLAGKYGYEAENTTVLFKVLGLMFYLHPGRRARLDAGVFYLSAQAGGCLLEVGCGSGSTLKGMVDLGWDAEGVDFDSNSVRNAQSKGLTVREGDLLAQNYPDNTFDAVVMSHVIEHLPNPLEVLQESYRILKPGGVLVVLTPNTESLGHRIYGENWRGLEPPRHLYLFNAASLENLAVESNFDDVMCDTSVRAWKIFALSRISAQDGSIDLQTGFSLKMRIWAESMEIIESIIKVFFSNAGEELKMIGKKNV